MIDNTAYLRSALTTIEAMRDLAPYSAFEFQPYIDMLEQDIKNALSCNGPVIIVGELADVSTNFPASYDAELKDTLRKSTWVFDRPGTEDDDEAYHTDFYTWMRARDILLDMCGRACFAQDGKYMFRPLLLPDISPAGTGTIDLWWHVDGVTLLLLNIGSDGFNSYYGEREGKKIMSSFFDKDEEHIARMTEFLL